MLSLKRTRCIIAASLILLLTACQLNAQSTPSTQLPDLTATALIRSSWTAVPVVVAVTPSATLTPTPVPPTATFTAVPPTNTATLTLTPTATITPTASITPIPTNTRRPTLTYTPSPAVTQIDTLVPGQLGGDVVTWTPQPPLKVMDEHFIFQRPIGQEYNNYWARNYSYGSTDGNSRPVHHGLDLENGAGTPVLAAANGVVYYAGPDTQILFGPQPDFYGNVIVIDHQIKDALGRELYTLYGHLSEIGVKTGQTVKVGQTIGAVGSAGVAIGPHLHFEVRAENPNDYNATLNPELWIIPYFDYGAFTARVMDLQGNPLYGVLVEVQGPGGYRSGYSYGDNGVNGDPMLNENVVVSDLPEGFYTVFVKKDGTLKFRTTVFVKSKRSTWIPINIDPRSS